MIQLTKDKAFRILSQPNGQERLMEYAEEAMPLAIELFLEDGDASALGFLSRIAKRDRAREYITQAMSESDALSQALKSENFKLRKNAAKLMGALADVSYVSELIAALNSEGSRMVVPSIILALGSLNTQEARAALYAHEVKPAETEYEEKHVEAERQALKKALSKGEKAQKHVFTGFSQEVNFKLMCADGLSDALIAELVEKGFAPYDRMRNSVKLKTRDAQSLYTVRCAKDILVIVSNNTRYDPDSIASIIKKSASAIYDAHSPDAPMRYRIALYGVLDKAEHIRRIETAIGDIFINSVGDYEIEICITVDRDRASVYYKLHTIEDKRFSYRLNALPASINPAVAAGMLRMAGEYLRDDARVLDPFCGSGTILIEREKLMGAASLTGVDISHKAIDIARENAKAAESRARFICNDCLRFGANRLYDELITNMPFGNRVSNHKDNEALYAGFVDKIPTWMENGALLILYTMEFALLKRLIAKAPNIELIKLEKTEAGGLMPGVFICKVIKE